MSQIIYILTNPYMPELALIGYFDVGTLEKEMQRLEGEGVPDRFVYEYAAEVADAEKVEEEVRENYTDAFVRNGRGFFKKELITKARAIIEKQKIKNITPDSQTDKNDEDDEKTFSRGEAFDFYKLNIKQGEVLTFIEDENIICSVYDNKKVKLGIANMSFYRATKMSYRAINKPIPSERYRGNCHWNYNGKKLLDIWNDYLSKKGK